MWLFNKKTTLNIVCPNCSHENKIEYGENILCSECNKTFAGHTYKRFKKPLVSATTALIIGAVGAHQINEHVLERERYPVSVEYEIMDNCINSSRYGMNSQWRADKAKVCACALRKTMNDIPYGEMEEEGGSRQFSTRFRSAVAECR